MGWTAESLHPGTPVVVVDVSGSVRAEDIDELRRTVKSLILKDHLERVLVDARELVHLPSPEEIVAVAASMSATQLPAGFRAAHVRPTDPWAAMWTQHWVAASNNRGLVTQSFHTRTEAMDWLLSTQAAAPDAGA